MAGTHCSESVLHRHRERPQQVVGELRVGELEVALVVELEQGGRVGVFFLEVQVVDLRFVGGVAALLAHVHLLGEWEGRMELEMWEKWQTTLRRL